MSDNSISVPTECAEARIVETRSLTRDMALQRPGQAVAARILGRIGDCSGHAQFRPAPHGRTRQLPNTSRRAGRFSIRPRLFLPVEAGPLATSMLECGPCPTAPGGRRSLFGREANTLMSKPPSLNPLLAARLRGPRRGAAEPLRRRSAPHLRLTTDGDDSGKQPDPSACPAREEACSSLTSIESTLADLSLAEAALGRIGRLLCDLAEVTRPPSIGRRRSPAETRVIQACIDESLRTIDAVVEATQSGDKWLLTGTWRPSFSPGPNRSAQFFPVASMRTRGADGPAAAIGSLRSGGPCALSKTSLAEAHEIVVNANRQVEVLRKQILAFGQRVLQAAPDERRLAIENRRANQTAVSDADFAAATSRLTRADVLLHSAPPPRGVPRGSHPIQSRHPLR